MRSSGAPLAVSTWTEVELLSAIGIKARSKQLSKAGAGKVIDSYRRRVAPLLLQLPVHNIHHHQAIGLLDGRRTSLRGGDGLHLAIAAANAATVWTLDRGMASAGKMLGLPVNLVE